MTPPRARHLVVGLSGASGPHYGIRFVEHALRLGFDVHLMVSQSAWRVMQEECGMEGVGPASPAETWLRIPEGARRRLHEYNNRDVAARPASGTFKAEAMVIVPASMKTVAALAHGYTDNLLTRTADVFLKERRPLVVVPRETPLSLIHLRNLTTLAEAGAMILPAMPGFYHRPRTLDDLFDFLAMKIFDAIGVEHDIPHAWMGPGGSV